MPRVKTILKNASTNINGIQFERVDDAMVSEEIDQATADLFLSIPGFTEECRQSAPKDAEPVNEPVNEPVTEPVNEPVTEDSIGDFFDVDLPKAKPKRAVKK